MKMQFFKISKVNSDLIITLIFIILSFIIFHYLDAFEQLHEITRGHEHWEADEFILLFLALPIPLIWFSYRRFIDIKKSAALQAVIEKTLAHSRKLESLGALAGGVAHEINNQLHPVILLADQMLKKLDKSDPNRKKIELILFSAEKSRETILKIKEFSQFDENTTQLCDVLNVLKHSEKMIKYFTPKTIDIKFDTNLLTGTVPLSATNLEAIMINLINNAIDAMKDKTGVISVQAKIILLSSPSSPVLSSGKYAIIAVHDDGNGMSGEVVNKVFDPFFTTKEVGHGMGVGLSIVYSIIHRAGGHIDVDSEEGKGSTFTVYLPLIDSDELSPNKSR